MPLFGLTFIVFQPTECMQRLPCPFYYCCQVQVYGDKIDRLMTVWLGSVVGRVPTLSAEGAGF